MLNLEREIKRKTLTYGITALLLAVLFTAISYDLGVQLEVQPVFTQLQTFSSFEELTNFLQTNMKIAQEFSGRTTSLGGWTVFDAQSSVPAPKTEADAPLVHSTTNIQVVGVDEADIVKTDDAGYLYVVSRDTIYVLRAYPPTDAEVLSKISFNETYNLAIYVNNDRLIILGEHYPYETSIRIAPPYFNIQEVFVKIFDISNRANPVLARAVSLNGTLSGSRMIGDYVYAVINQPVVGPNSNETYVEVVLPKIRVDNNVKEVQPTEMHYVNVSDFSYYSTTVVAVNIMNDAQEPTYEPFLTGTTTCMYVSLNNMYLTVPNMNVWITTRETTEAREETLIYRIKLDREKVINEAGGTVPGYVLNQFSMDEHNGFFRVATTTWTSEMNNLYVLNMSLNIVGKLEGLAPKESIYSARFMGERCYLVTFKKIDPLFVIDLTDPLNPKVLGKLKIPGYSDYLHPYDENHLIGIGKNTVEAKEGDFAWYQGIKISLFDVSDVELPKEITNFTVGDRGTDSPVLYDHKALLFDRKLDLLTMPILLAEIDEKQYPNGVPPDAYGEYVWQGLYVFNLTENEITLRGRITHIKNESDLLKSGYYFASEYSVKRALYIENVLYTLSDKKITMHTLEDLVLITEIEFPIAF